LWTCEPRWRVAWYHTGDLEARCIALYNLVDSVPQRQASWVQLLGDVAPSFPAALGGSNHISEIHAMPRWSFDPISTHNDRQV
jgi:hypothetical protein